MKYHYIPPINEAEFNKIAKSADPVLIERRRIAAIQEIVKCRSELFHELSCLRNKPFCTSQENKRKKELEQEAKDMMRKIANLSRRNFYGKR